MITMFELLANSPTADTVFFLTLGALIISLLANLHFFQLHHLGGRRHRSGGSMAVRTIQQYLREQKDRTQSHMKTRRGDGLSRSAVRLRTAYLAIEDKAIDRGIDSEEYWNLINAKVQQLFSLLIEQQNARPLAEIEHKIRAIKNEIAACSDSTTANAVLKSLDRFRLACIESANNSKKLGHYNDKLTELLLKLSNKNYRKIGNKIGKQKIYLGQSKDALVTIKSQLKDDHSSYIQMRNLGGAELHGRLDHLQENNERIQEQIDKHHLKLRGIRRTIDDRSRDVMRDNNDAATPELDMELNALTEQIIESNQQEISRLSDLVKQQRLTIIELEESVKSASETDQKHNSKELQQETEILKRSLFESEQCIKILENQLEEFKEKISTTDNEGENLLNENHVASMQASIDELESEVSQNRALKKQHELLLSFFQESLSQTNVEDMSVLVYHTLTELGFDAQLLIFANNRELELGTRGKLPERKKIILRNMRVNDQNPDTGGQGLCFRYKNLGGYLGTRHDATESSELDLALQLLKGGDRVFERLKDSMQVKNHRKIIDDCTNAIKLAAHDVDEQLEAFTARTKAKVQDSFGQMQDVARARGMTAAQIASFRSLEKDALKALENDSALRLQTRKRFLSLLKKIEN